MPARAFDTTAYYDAQMAAFTDRFSEGEQQVIEFGGKSFGDYHAARVLPGYDPDIKAQILHDVVTELGNTTVAMSLHAQDVLALPDGRRPKRRIRGDSLLHYDEEVLRLTDQARNEFAIPVSTIVLAALPRTLSNENADYIAEYSERLTSEGLIVKHIGYIAGYPFLDVGSLPVTLTRDEAITADDNLVVISPGGGSGKFGVAVTEIAHKLAAGHNPNFVKFETFPVFNLPVAHPLNTAFLAATADLPNTLVRTNNGQTNYDKDVQNLSILQSLLTHYPDIDSPLRAFTEPTDMGVNRIESGINDVAAVNQACMEEIRRRIIRYSSEQDRGYETSQTVSLTTEYFASMQATHRSE